MEVFSIPILQLGLKGLKGVDLSKKATQDFYSKDEAPYIPDLEGKHTCDLMQTLKNGSLSQSSLHCHSQAPHSRLKSILKVKMTLHWMSNSFHNTFAWLWGMNKKCERFPSIRSFKQDLICTEKCPKMVRLIPLEGKGRCFPIAVIWFCMEPLQSSLLYLTSISQARLAADSFSQSGILYAARHLCETSLTESQRTPSKQVLWIECWVLLELCARLTSNKHKTFWTLDQVAKGWDNRVEGTAYINRMHDIEKCICSGTSEIKI